MVGCASVPEATRLTLADAVLRLPVDLAEAILTIRVTKF